MQNLGIFYIWTPVLFRIKVFHVASTGSATERSKIDEVCPPLLLLTKRLTGDKTLLRFDRIGIDAQENVTKLRAVQTTLYLVELVLGIFRELLYILRSVKLSVLVTMVNKVVGDIVGLPKLVTGNDSLVNGMSYSLITVILVATGRQLDLIRSQRQTKVKMYIALLLADAHHNTVHVLRASLDILLSSGYKDLTGLADIARLIFIGDAQRHYIQLGEILLKRFRAAHVQQFRLWYAPAFEPTR